MAKVFEHVKAVLADDEGQDLLEYAMLIGLIAVVAAGTVTQLGFIIKTAFWDAIVAANI
jgi:Flp pilus assembly pilin Flp